MATATMSQEAVTALDNLLRFFNTGLVAQDFTESEQSCISDKIGKLRAEGKDQNQAIAIAISECAPEKASGSANIKSMLKASARASTKKGDKPAEEDQLQADAKPNIPGGDYKAVQNSNQTWDVFDVPVWMTHSRRFMGRDITIDKPWLETALKNSVRRFAKNQYLPPVHIQHHGMGGDVSRAGLFRLRAVRPATFEGKKVHVLFADLIQVDSEVFADVRAGKLPYRSVEILDVKKKEVDSLALLDHEVPYFRLPMLTIGQELPFEAMTFHRAVRCKDETPVMAYRALEHGRGRQGISTLYYFGGDIMSKLDYNSPDSSVATDTPDVVAQDEGKDDDEAMQSALDDEGREEATTIVKAMIEGLTRLGAILSGGDGADTGDEGGAEAPAPVEMADETKDVVKSAAETDAAMLTASAGKPAATGSAREIKQSARLDAVELELGTGKAVTYAQDELGQYGLSPKAVKKRVDEIMPKFGMPGVKLYVETVKANVRPDPPKGGSLTGAARQGIDKTVSKFSKLGDKGMERAIFYGKEFDDHKARGRRFQFTKEQYIIDCLGPEGFDLTGVIAEQEAK